MGLGCKGIGCRVSGFLDLGCRVQGLGFRVYAFRFRVTWVSIQLRRVSGIPRNSRILDLNHQGRLFKSRGPHFGGFVRDLSRVVLYCLSAKAPSVLRLQTPQPTVQYI